MILWLSASVPPEVSGAAVVTQNLASQFQRDEMIIVGERPPSRPAVIWKPEWPRIVYATSRWSPNRRGARWWRRLQVPLLLIRTLFTVLRHRCDTLIVVSPPAEFLLVALIVAKVTRVRLIPYFHNFFYLPRTAPIPGARTMRFKKWLQAQVFRQADHVLVMSEGMANLFGELYPEVTCSPLVHSFSEEIPAFVPPPPPRTPLRVVLAGNINEACREATQRLSAALRQMDDVSLTLYGGTPDEILREYGVLHEGVEHRTPPRDEFIAGLRSSDVLLLPHGFDGSLPPEEYLTIFPTRTIEYLISGRPILAHAPADCFLTRFLERHHCALVIKERSTERVIEGIKRLRSDQKLRADLVRNALQTAEMFRALRVAQTLRERVGNVRKLVAAGAGRSRT